MVDETETEIGPGQFVDDNIFASQTRLMPMVVVVSGPDHEGEICVLAAGESYLPPETAEGLAREILRRLGKT